MKNTSDLINRYYDNAEFKGGKSSFNEVETVKNVPIIEGSATYNLIPANFREFTANNGTTGAENRMFKCSTGTDSGGYGAIQSFRAISHRVGQGAKVRFSGYFSSSAANSWQGVGLISIGEEMSFGYNGASFGVWHRYGGLSEVRTITITTGAGGAETLTLTLNDVEYSIPLTSGTAAHNAYQIAAWLNNSSNQSVWGADQINDTVIINALSDGAKSGTYSYSSSGTGAGSIAQNTAGVTKTSDFVAQTDWNIDKMPSLDPTKGNLYKIQYLNMGFGSIIYYVFDPKTHKYNKVHAITLVNISTTLGIPNPSLRVGMYCVSLGSTTNLGVYVNSFGAFAEGDGNKTRNARAASATQTITTTTETAILTVRNRRTYNGINNQIDIEPLNVSVSNETSRNAIVRVRTTSNVGIEQNFTNAGTNLVSDVDTTAVNFTGGNLIASKGLGPTQTIDINLRELELTQPPSLNLVITVERTATGGSNQNFTGTYTWYEDL